MLVALLLALLLVLREAQGADMCQGGDGWTEHIPNASATVVPDDGWYTSDNAESCTAACIRHGLECDPDHDTIAKTEAEMQAVGTATGVYDGLGCGSFQDGGTRVARRTVESRAGIGRVVQRAQIAEGAACSDVYRLFDVESRTSRPSPARC